MCVLVCAPVPQLSDMFNTYGLNPPTLLLSGSSLDIFVRGGGGGGGVIMIKGCDINHAFKASVNYSFPRRFWSVVSVTVTYDRTNGQNSLCM